MPETKKGGNKNSTIVNFPNFASFSILIFFSDKFRELRREFTRFVAEKFDKISIFLISHSFLSTLHLSKGLHFSFLGTIPIFVNKIKIKNNPVH